MCHPNADILCRHPAVLKIGTLVTCLGGTFTLILFCSVSFRFQVRSLYGIE